MDEARGSGIETGRPRTGGERVFILARARSWDTAHCGAAAGRVWEDPCC